MTNLKAHECLTVEREKELGLLAASGNKNAKDELVMSNIKFVAAFSKKFSGLGLSQEELFEEGLIGLCQAVEHFNPNKGARLTTYASFWIRNAILDAINESGVRIRLSGDKARKVIKLRKALAEAKSFLEDEEACFEYACTSCNCTKIEAKKLLTLSQDMLFLDSPILNDSQSSFASQLQDTNYSSIEDSFLQKELHEKLTNAINNLKQEEQNVLKMHYGLTGCEPEAFSSIAKKIGKSRARVHQIERYAMKRIERELLASGF